MVARKVAARLKPDSLERFAHLMDREILPWLQEQEGFLDLITLAGADGTEVATISFWDHSGNGHACNTNAYPEALKLLGELLDGSPNMKTFEVVNSTLHRRAGLQSSETRDLVQ